MLQKIFLFSMTALLILQSCAKESKIPANKNLSSRMLLLAIEQYSTAHDGRYASSFVQFVQFLPKEQRQAYIEHTSDITEDQMLLLRHGDIKTIRSLKKPDWFYYACGGNGNSYFIASTNSAGNFFPGVGGAPFVLSNQ